MKRINILSILPDEEEKINHQFLILLIGRFISQLGDKLYLIALPWLVLEITHSALQSSITLALETLPQIIFSPFIGVFVDRNSRKKIMVISDWIRGFIILTITFLAYTGNIEMYHIYISAILLSIFTLFFDSAGEGYLTNIVRKEQLLDANATLTFINTLNRLIGPVLAGIMIGMLGATFTIGINGISFILSGVFLCFLSKDKVIEKLNISTKKIVAEIKEGFHYLIHHQVLFPIAIFSTSMNIGIFLVTTLLIYESKEILGYNPTETAIIFWVSGIFASITTILLKYLNKFFDKGQMIRFGSLFVLLAILLLVFEQSIITFTISYSILLMVGIVVNVSMMTYRQEVIPTQLFGRVMTSTKVFSQSLVPITIIASGWLAMSYSPRLVFIIAAMITAINVLYAWFSNLKQIK